MTAAGTPLRRPLACGVGWSLATVGLVVLLLGPALGAGYVLAYDMVFVPRQSLLPGSVGLGGGLPRAVPQDAVMAALTVLAEGAVWQHLVLVGVVAGGAWGAARLVTGAPTWQRVATATVYVWSAYLVERLVLGAWALLVAYAALPWLVRTALDVRRRGRGAVARLLLLVGLSSLVPTGGVLAVVVGVPIAAGPGSGATRRARVLSVLGALALQAPWVVPSVLHPAAGQADPAGAEVFGLRPEGPWGPVLTALGTGGVWNGDVVPSSRTTWLAPAVTLLLLALTAAGWRRSIRWLGRSGRAWLAVTAGVALVWAVATYWFPGPTAALGAAVPGGGLLRDAQKWLAPLALLIAVCAPAGLQRLTSRADTTLRVLLAAALAVVPVAAMPDAAWGASGRLTAVDYPSEWEEVRAFLSEQPAASGDVVVLPWSAFRAFDWNAGRTSLDPAPRWLPRTAVVADSLLVARPGGTVVAVSGEDPRAAAVGSALRGGRPLAEVLPALGVGWVLVEGATRGPPVPASQLAGYRPVLDVGSLALLSGPPAGPTPTAGPGRVAAVVTAYLLAAGVLLAAALALARERWSRPFPG